MLSIIAEFLKGENQLYTLVGKAELGANDEKKLSDVVYYKDLFRTKSLSSYRLLHPAMVLNTLKNYGLVNYLNDS